MKRKQSIKQNILTIVLILTFAFVGSALAEQKVYPIKGNHPGGNLTPSEAFNMMKKDPEHTFLIDVRTRFEYQDIGHPIGAYNIPLKFYTTEVGKKGYQKVLNQNFGNDLKARFNPETDILLFLCRSAKRSVQAVNAAVDAGFKPDKLFNVLGGFEGDKVKNKTSPFYGKRFVGGWRLEGLPWTYKMKPDLIYQPDLKK